MSPKVVFLTLVVVTVCFLAFPESGNCQLFGECLPDGFACNPIVAVAGGCCSGFCVVINGQIEGLCQDADDK